MKVKSDHRSKFSNLSNWKEEAWKKIQCFNEIRTRDLRDTGAMLYRAMKPHIGSEVNLLSSYLRVQWNDVKFLYEIIHICTAVVDESEEKIYCFTASYLNYLPAPCLASKRVVKGGS